MEEAHAAVEHVRAAGLIRDRRWRFRKYKNVFVGSEAVTALVQSGAAASRDAAGAQLRTALESDLIAHAVREHHFRDAFLFYKIVSDSDAGEEEKSSCGAKLSMAEIKEGAKKHGSAAVRSGKFTNEGRYLVLSADNVLHEFASPHAPFPVRVLPLDQCASGAVSFCGKLKSGKFGITVHPPLCELHGEKEQEAASAFAEDQRTTLVLLFDQIKDQESWLHNLVKGGLAFKELAFETNDASTANSIYDFTVDMPNVSAPRDLRDLTEGRVVIVVNVASF